MSSMQVEAFKAIAAQTFPEASGEVLVDAGSTAYVVTLDDGEAVGAEPVEP